MDEELEAAIESEGWIVECKSPLEIRLQDDPESFASGFAAQTIIEAIVKRLKRKKKKESKPQPDPNDMNTWEYGKDGWL
jgi:hypothetical protein